jgi:NAD(P)-dependent dehydrogenase (short-subunit alcohol dehydrogenase family)
MGATVVVTGRSRASGETAVQEMIQATGNQRIELLTGDISTRAGVEAVAAAFLLRHSRLDVLINNAGAAEPALRKTEDGLEANFATNVVAPYLLTTQLLPALKASPAGRVVTLAGGDLPDTLDLSNLQSELTFQGLNGYSQTKVAMMCVMYALSQRLIGEGITVNVCYPGQASTNMTQSVTREMLPALMRPIFPLFKFVTRPDNGKSAQKASRSSVFLATAPELQGKTGQYYTAKMKNAPWPAPVQDAQIRQAVWDYLMRNLPTSPATR